MTGIPPAWYVRAAPPTLPWPIPCFPPRPSPPLPPLQRQHRQQDTIIRTHLARWLARPRGVREMRDDCRDLNQYTSQDVFLGPYLLEPGVREKFSQGYSNMTAGFLVGAVRRECGPPPPPCLVGGMGGGGGGGVLWRGRMRRKVLRPTRAAR